MPYRDASQGLTHKGRRPKHHAAPKLEATGEVIFRLLENPSQSCHMSGWSRCPAWGMHPLYKVAARRTICGSLGVVPSCLQVPRQDFDRNRRVEPSFNVTLKWDASRIGIAFGRAPISGRQWPMLVFWAIPSRGKSASLHHALASFRRADVPDQCISFVGNNCARRAR